MTSNDDPNRIEKQAHRYAGYEAHDQKGEPVGEVDDLFVDTANGQEYVELNMGVLGLRSTVVPLEICEVDDERMIVAIPQSRSKLRRAPRKRAPLLGDEIMAITPEYEDRIRSYFGLEPSAPPTEERPFRAFSTAYPTQGETPRGEVRPVEARRLDSTTGEPEATQPQTADEAVPEPQATEPAPPRVVQPYKIEAQEAEPDAVASQEDVEPAEPEVAAAQQDAEAAGSEVEEPREAAEPEAIDLAAAEDDAVEVRTAEPDVVEVRTVEPEDARTDETPDAAVSVGESGSGAGEASDAETLPEEAEAPEPAYASSDTSEQEASQPAAEETPQAPVTASAQGVADAGQQMTEAARRSLQALTDRAVKAQQSSLDLSGSIAQSFVQQLRTQTQGNRQATETLQQQGQRQQQALQTIVQSSVSAYANLFTSTFSLYQQALQTATRVALGNVQAASRFAQRGATAAAAGSQSGAVEATRGSMEAMNQAAAQEGSAEVSQGQPARQSSAGASPAPPAEQEGSEEITSSQANVPDATQDVGTVEGAAREDAGGTEPAVGQDGPDSGIDEAAPAGATPSDPLLPPPPVVPNMLDGLRPAPQVPSVDETLSDEEGPRGQR